MMLQDRLRRTTVVAAAALAMTLGAAASLAQPGSAPHGPHGRGASGDMIGHVMENAKAQLNLNTSQQQMFDAAVANTKAAHQTGLSLHQSVKDKLTAELAKTEPDLAAVAAASDNVQAQGQALRKSVRAQWLALYATFSPDQKAVVRDALQKRIAKAESFRQKMQDRFSGKTGKTN
jgi:Spy/CpxP family protein refolding chaperone